MQEKVESEIFSNKEFHIRYYEKLTTLQNYWLILLHQVFPSLAKFHAGRKEKQNPVLLKYQQFSSIY